MLAPPTAQPAEPELDAAALVDSYAEHLMETLFEDVDQLLEGKEISPLADPAVGLGSTDLATVPLAEDAAITAASSAAATALQTVTTEAVAEAVATPPARRRFKLSLEYLLLAIALGSAASLGILWALGQQRLDSVPVTAGAGPAPAQSNAEFLNYLQRSMEVIASRAPADGSATSNVPLASLPGPAIVVPPAPVGTAAIQGGRAPINVIERVYVPYQVAPGPSAAVPAAPATAAAPSAAAPAAIHTLVGVLELGARSAALFEVNGVPQRIYIGERIGSSGWSLVSVSNEEAVVRRNGEVRSIYIGQKF
jgi:hypothetical protein